MIIGGQVVLFRFQHTDQEAGKLRPALVLRRVPGKFNDWLICMITSQVYQMVAELDDKISPNDSDFGKSGLKIPSLIRASRLAVVDGKILEGTLGQIGNDRLSRIRRNIAHWIQGPHENLQPQPATSN
jgi:mRNA interferase MazF